MGGLSASHWLVVIIAGFALLLIFNGSRKIPELARGLGRGMRIFKSELNELKNDQHHDEKPSTLTEHTPQLPIAQQHQDHSTAVSSELAN